MPKILDISYAGELGASNYILGIRDGKAVRFPVEVFEDEPVVNSSFVSLTDTPTNYVDQAGKLAAVNSTETGLEFVDPPEGDYAFTDLTDTPDAYTGQGGKLVKVNSGGTGLEFGDAPASTFLALSDTPDSYSAYVGKVVAVKADGSGLEFVSPASGSYTIVDLSAATSDYLLSPGEVAKITYSSATSVPLHIATEEGEYDVCIVGSTEGYSSTSNVLLIPNSGSISTIKCRRDSIPLNSTSAITVIRNSAQSSMYIGDYILNMSKFIVTTSKVNKTAIGNAITSRSAQKDFAYKFYNVWEDTTTAWYSLGTITFPVAQSGTITVRRII